MPLRLISIATAVAMTLSAAAAQAANLDDIFSVRGYGTVGAAYSDEDQADFVSVALQQPDGAGYTHDVTYKLDTRAALQIDAKFSDRWSAVVQLVSENLDNNSWDGDINKPFVPSVEWANISYRPTDNLTIRGGRIMSPFLMTAEYRKVGYATHWLRAPVEVYGQFPFSSSDGADVSYRSTLGKATNTLRAHYGFNTLRIETGKAQARVYGVNDSYETGSLTLRAAYLNVHFETPDQLGALLNPFIAAVSSLPFGMGDEAASAARHLEARYNTANTQEINLYALGASYDPGDWFIMAEAVHTKSPGVLQENDSGYVSGGIRVKKFTPYVTLSILDKKHVDEDGIPLAGLPAPLAGFGGLINSIMVPIAQNPTSQQTLSLGARWDLMTNIALKAQYDHIDLDKGSHGLLGNIQPGFVPGGSLNVISLTVDFVF